MLQTLQMPNFREIAKWTKEMMSDIIFNSIEKGETKMYIDPNTGGLLFQALAAVFVAGSGVLLFFSRNIREGIAKLRRRMRKEDEEQDK
jgi:hypothetical protein